MRVKRSKHVDALIQPEYNHLAHASQGQLCENELNKLLQALESTSNQLLVTKDPEQRSAVQENLKEVSKQLIPYQLYLVKDMQTRIGTLQELGKAEESINIPDLSRSHSR